MIVNAQGSGFDELDHCPFHGDLEQPDPDRLPWVVADYLRSDNPELAASVRLYHRSSEPIREAVFQYLERRGAPPGPLGTRSTRGASLACR